MPGLVGFSATASNFNSREAMVGCLAKMQAQITYGSYYAADELFCDGNICSTRSHPDIIQKDKQPAASDGVFVWLDGEFYNGQELSGRYGLAYSNDCRLMLDLYSKESGLEFLKGIDGIFSAVIYDSKLRRVLICNDRYGLRHIYFSALKDSLLWASEYKAFLIHPKFQVKIDRTAVKDFFETGYLVGDRTWFKDVSLLPSGTVLQFDLESKNLSQTRYWWWDSIGGIGDELKEDEIADRLGELFLNAVRSRCTRGYRYNLTLSGGLDSRAILAALPKDDLQLQTATFGLAGSDDQLFAAMAAKKRGVCHSVFEINSDNWLEPRIEAVWWTDGQLNLVHMHGVEVLDKVKQIGEISLNGFLGDAMLGGLYVDDPKWTPVEKFNNRARRFIALGPRIYQTAMEVRFPFAENKLVEFAASIPVDLKRNWYIYKKMLLRIFPDYYRSIPWQKTGYPISWSDTRIKLHKFAGKISWKFKRGMSKVGIRIGKGGSSGFTDYPGWVRSAPNRRYFEQVLFSDKAIYPEFIDPVKVKGDFEAHMTGENRFEVLGLYLTFEIWLQRVFRGKILSYRE